LNNDVTVGSEILRLRDRDPFTPFTIVMSSGDRYRIDDPIELAMGRDALVVIPITRIAHIVLRYQAIAAVEVVETVMRPPASTD
jgi:hypothetical protein